MPSLSLAIIDGGFVGAFETILVDDDDIMGRCDNIVCVGNDDVENYPFIIHVGALKEDDVIITLGSYIEPDDLDADDNERKDEGNKDH